MHGIWRINLAAECSLPSGQSLVGLGLECKRRLGPSLRTIGPPGPEALPDLFEQGYFGRPNGEGLGALLGGAAYRLDHQDKDTAQ